MDYTKTGIIGTKHRLWKKKTTVFSIINDLQNKGYTFKEVVLGEPNNFIFADHYEELEELFKKKGFYGIRIKMEQEGNLLEINSNSDGIDNVQYTIFAQDEETYTKMHHDIEYITGTLKPSNETVEKINEYFIQHRQLRNIILLALVGIILYFLGVHVFLFNIVGFLFSFSPFLMIYVIYLFARRR